MEIIRLIGSDIRLDKNCSIEPDSIIITGKTPLFEPGAKLFPGGG
jgi:hypothetical protein